MGYVASGNGLRSIREWHQRMGYVASENGLRSIREWVKTKLHTCQCFQVYGISENWNTIYGQNLKNTDEKCAITHFITMPLFSVIE